MDARLRYPAIPYVTPIIIFKDSNIRPGNLAEETDYIFVLELWKNLRFKVSPFLTPSNSGSSYYDALTLL